MKSLDQYWGSVNFISILLLPLSLVFYLISQFRKFFYKTGVAASYKSPVPVIVVGNISVGGTGKTPLIIELVKQLQKKSKKPAVISRGYGGQSATWPQIVNANTQAKQVGDEPQLIFQHTGCPVVVGPNRKDNIELLLKIFSCDVILSDDGMQHYALQRDIEICVVDSQKQLGNGFLIPAGPLRESSSRLKTVDLILYNAGDDSDDSFELKPTKCIPISKNGAEHKLSFFSGKTVHAIAGIGNPQRFFCMLEKHNINVIPHSYKDHYNYQLSDLLFDDELSVLMTEKDAVKCTGLGLESSSLDKPDFNRYWSVPVDVLFSQSAEHKLNKIFDSIL